MLGFILRWLGLVVTVWFVVGVSRAAAILAGGQAPALVQADLGALSGTVTDVTGAVLPATPVILASQSRTQQGYTDAAGRFSFRTPPCLCRVQVQVPGFTPYLSLPVKVKANGSSTVNVQLAVAVVQERVDVGTGNSLNPDDNASALQFSGDRLNLLSGDPTTLQQQINALAGPGLGGGTQMLVNGFTGGRLPPKSSIRSISVNRNPYSAYYDSPGFGRVEIDTKPGGDAFHGNLNFAGTNQPLDSRNPYTGLQPPFYQFQSDGTLTGPLGKGTSFFLSENVQQLANNAVVNADVLDVANSPATLSQAVPSPQRTQTYAGRVDRQFTPSNFGFLRNEWSQTRLQNGGIAPLILPSSAYTANTLTDTLQMADTQLLGPHAVNEARFQYLRSRTAQEPNSTAPTLLVQGAFQSFGNPSQTLRDSQDRYELQDRLELDHGRHAVRLGFRLRALRESNRSEANYNGQYTFNNLAAYQLTVQNLANCAQPANANCLTAAQLRTNGGGASQFNITTGQASALLYNDDFGLYVEDDWKLKRNLTLSYGVRFESQSAVPDHADPAPRLGIAWGVRRGKNPAPVLTLRAGYGIFYQRFGPAGLLQAVRQNGVSQSAFFAQNPDFYRQNADGSPTLPALGQLAANEPTLYRVDPHLRTAYSQVGSVGVDRRIGHRGTVSLNALYSHATHNVLLRNINAPLPGSFDPNTPNSGIRPLGTTQNIYQYSADSNENDEILFATTQLQITKTLFAFSFYVLQRQYEEPEGLTSFPSNQYDLRADYARSSSTQKQALNTGLFWTLPRGFDTALLFNARSGMPFDITTGTDDNGDTVYNDRPAFATDLTRPSVVRTAFGNFDIAPLPGQALIPRNYGDSPALVYLNLQLNKAFHLGPRPRAPASAAASANARPAVAAASPDRPWELKFGVEVQNVLNHNNPGLPIGVLSSPSFGHSLSLANDYNPLTASNRTLLLHSAFTF